MLALTAAIAVATARPETVIAARFYNPAEGSLPRTSFDLYAIDGVGRRTRLAHHAEGDVVWCRFILGHPGQRKVAYEVDSGGDVPMLWSYDLRSRTRRRIGPAKFVEDDSTETGIFPVPGTLPHIADMYPSLVPIRVKAAAFIPLTGDQARPFHPADPTKDGFAIDGDEVHYRGHTINIPGTGVIGWAIADPLTDDVYIARRDSLSSWGLWFTVSKIDWRGLMAKPIITNAQNIDWYPRHHWAAYTSHRKITPYGPDRHVWTSTAFLKNTQTGELWTLASGLVQVYSATYDPAFRE